MFQKSRRTSKVLSLLFVGLLVLCTAAASGQELRKRIANPPPVYPEIAKRMQLVGVVKIDVVIGPDGKIKGCRVIGGHPVLVDAAMIALRDWRCEKTNFRNEDAA